MSLLTDIQQVYLDAGSSTKFNLHTKATGNSKSLYARPTSPASLSVLLGESSNVQVGDKFFNTKLITTAGAITAVSAEGELTVNIDTVVPTFIAETILLYAYNNAGTFTIDYLSSDAAEFTIGDPDTYGVDFPICEITTTVGMTEITSMTDVRKKSFGSIVAPVIATAYIYGGYTGSYIQDTDEYNIISSIWTSKTNIPTPTRGALAASTILNKGYIYCGRNTTLTPFFQDCDEYDNSGDSWANKTDAPSPARALLSASTILDKGYVYGGFTTVALQDCDEFNSIGNSWANKTNLPTPARTETAASTILDKGYVYYGGDGGSTPTTDCDEYDSVGNSWANKTNAPATARASLAGSTILDKGYVYGGKTAVPTYTQDCDEYNSVGNSWTSKTNMPTPGRHQNSASTIDNKGCSFAGNSGAGVIADCDAYNPLGDFWSSLVDIVSPSRNLTASSAI